MSKKIELGDLGAGTNVRNALREIAEVNGFCAEASFENATERSRRTGEIYATERAKLLPVLNAAATNTIDTTLKRVLVLNENVRDFALVALPLRMFSTDFGNVPLEGTDQAAVSYYPLQVTTSSDFTDGDGTGGTGYQFGQATNTNSKTITVNKRKYQPLDYSSYEFQRQPFFSAVKLGKMNAEKLAYDILTDIFSVFTLANYPTVAQADPNFNPNLKLPSAAYTSEQIADLETVANNLNWPTVGRSLITNTTIKNALAKDRTYSLALNIGTEEVIQDAKFPKLSGFDYAWTPNLPANGATKLQGVIAFASALGVAFAPVKPAAGVMRQLVAYEIATDAMTGISMNYRHWGLAQADRDFEIIEGAFGYAPIIAKAAQLLTGA
jgi:hypothetical protein